MIDHVIESESSLPLRYHTVIAAQEEAIPDVTIANVVLVIGWANENPMIDFFIDGNSYEAEEGATWADWIMSEYYDPDSGVTISGGLVYGAYEGPYYLSSDEMIVPAAVYFSYISGGNN